MSRNERSEGGRCHTGEKGALTASWGSMDRRRPSSAARCTELPVYGKDEKKQVLFLSTISGRQGLPSPAESFELSNSTVAVLSVFQIILSHCQPSQSRWERAMQSGDANQFSFAEAIRTMPFPATRCWGFHASSESRSGAELTVAPL